ncbi:hypothetical protein ACFU3J_16175 [Streptomyces sp. NPDC057411]|uniref:hypothetical protein n=1 Tax=unclassified Streptomyces TaxID=2593676 RepID=UPI00362D1430
MTPPAPARRTLGTGPATEPIRAQEADLHGLPHIDMPDPADLRARGVLGPPKAPAPRTRRTLGTGTPPEPPRP